MGENIALVEGEEEEPTGMMSEAQREQVVAWFAGGSTSRDIVTLCASEFAVTIEQSDAALFYKTYRSQIADKARQMATRLTEIPRHDVAFVIGKLDHHAVLLEDMLQQAASDEALTAVVKLTEAWLRVLALMAAYRPPVPPDSGPQPLSKQLDQLPPEARQEAVALLTKLQDLIGTHIPEDAS